MEHIRIPSRVTQNLQKWTGQDMSAARKTANPLSYPKSSAPFSSKLFKNPTSEYRGCPLWSWNNKLELNQLLRQIDYFEEMGLGGFHIHVRVGLDTEYMGTEFMDIVKACVDYAESKNMLACLYDDDRWPSGAAGGKAIKGHPEHKAKHILLTPHLYGTIELGGDRTPTSGRACRSEDGFLIATFDIELDDNGCLKSSRRLKKGEQASNPWYAYVETNPGSPWFNGETYIDTLSKDAMAHFINITHEVYKDKIGNRFGTVVPCIFTDEPQFAIKTRLSNPWAGDDIFLPWTGDLAQSFKKEYSIDLIDALPELVWDLPEGEPSVARYRFHDHVCDRFVGAFMDQIGAWCKNNGLMLNGHMMEEPTLYSQTTALGEAMRCYRSMEMPGIDLLMDGIEYNTAKQASSVSRQNGTLGTMSEIYGVSHWYFTFEGHKGCGDWQAALGVTFRVHHLTWVSMAGEGKRDYPACIGYQSPWYSEYGYIETYFARVGIAMTRGRARTNIGVIHPIESYWLAFGPNGGGDEAGNRDQAFGDLTNWLLHGLVDFDFISESLLPNQVGKKISGKKLQVGKCDYEAIIVPNLRTIRSSTLKILQEFSKAGGTVIIAGSAPELVDGCRLSVNPTILKSKSVFWSQQSILKAVEKYRDLRITAAGGLLTDKLLHQIREDGDERFVFICNEDRSSPVDTVIQLKGHWSVHILDTFEGDEKPQKSQFVDGWTAFPYKFEGCASLLLRLSPYSNTLEQVFPSQIVFDMEHSKSSSEVALESVQLSEPNVLLLDYAEYKVNGGDWSEPTEVLRLDNEIRGHLQLPMKGEAWKQPWAVPPTDRIPQALVTLRFTFKSTFTIGQPTMFAIENPSEKTILINDTAIPTLSAGTAGEYNWWVDEAIKTIPVPANCIRKGRNTLTMAFPFGLLTNIERVYLLGSFFVSLRGRSIRLHPLDIKSLTWGDITTQGLPFYAGNIIYNCSLTVPTHAGSVSNPHFALSIPEFSSPALAVDNAETKERIGLIALQPHVLHLGDLNKDSRNRVTITAYGNRYNAFGHLHLPDGVTAVCGPNIWRTGGGWWTDDYMVKAMGILNTPRLLIGRENVVEVEDNDSWEIVGPVSVERVSE